MDVMPRNKNGQENGKTMLLVRTRQNGENGIRKIRNGPNRKGMEINPGESVTGKKRVLKGIERHGGIIGALPPLRLKIKREGVVPFKLLLLIA